MSGSGASHFAVLPPSFGQMSGLKDALNAAVDGTRVIETETCSQAVSREA